MKINIPQNLDYTEHTVGNTNISQNIEIRVLEGVEVYSGTNRNLSVLQMMKTADYYDLMQNNNDQDLFRTA